MKTVAILCSTPGFRRLGISHPASATYDVDRWSDTELELLKADPMFRVFESDNYGAPIPNVPIAGVSGSYDTLATAMHGDASLSDRYAQYKLRELLVKAGLVEAGAEIYRRGREGEADFVPLFFPGEEGFRHVEGDLHDAWPAGRDDTALSRPLGAVAAAIAGSTQAVREPAAVAPGADRSDAVQDNGSGPAIADLGAKALGVAEAGPVQTGSGIRSPIFDDARIQSIRVALKGFPADEDFTKTSSLGRLAKALKFRPTPEEIVAARVETVLPEATITT